MEASTESTTTSHVLKIMYEGEIRKYRNIKSYDNLIVSIAKTIGFKAMNCRFTYTDDDEDKITVSNDDDLQEAFSFFEPKIPKLELVPYTDQIDESVSQFKLCDSGILQQPVNVSNSQKSENDQDKSIKSIDMPFQMEKEDRPKQVAISFINESKNSNKDSVYKKEPSEENNSELSDSKLIFKSVAPEIEINCQDSQAKSQHSGKIFLRNQYVYRS